LDVNGTYVITGSVLTLTRTAGVILVFTYLDTTDEGMSIFNVVVGSKPESESYIFDTVEARNAAIPSSNGFGPALIMYLLN